MTGRRWGWSSPTTPVPPSRTTPSPTMPSQMSSCKTTPPPPSPATPSMAMDSAILSGRGRSLLCHHCAQNGGCVSTAYTRRAHGRGHWCDGMQNVTLRAGHMGTPANNRRSGRDDALAVPQQNMVLTVNLGVLPSAERSRLTASPSSPRGFIQFAEKFEG